MKNRLHPILSLLLGLVSATSAVAAALPGDGADGPVGGAIHISGPGDEWYPAVAYDETNEVYLVVWMRTDMLPYLILAQRVSKTGALIGGSTYIGDGAWNFVAPPVVANVQGSDRFLVVWETEGPSGSFDIVGRAVDAATGALSNQITIAGTSASERHPAACGEPTTIDDEALVVWEEYEAGIRVAQVHVPPTGDPSAFVPVVLSTHPDDAYPMISHSLGAGGRALVAWTRWFDGSPGDHDVVCRAIARNVSPMSETSLLATIGADEEHVEVAGDGESWLVSYSWSPYDGGPRDVRARRATEWAGSLVYDDEFAVVEGGGNEYLPAVGLIGNVYLTAWLHYWGGTIESYARTLTADTCLPCEPEVQVGAWTTEDTTSVQLATQYGAGLTGDEALLVFVVGEYGSTSIMAQRWRSEVGHVTDLGGGCGQGGTASVGCALAGNDWFQHRLAGAAPSSVAWLAIGFQRLDAPCGGCVLVPDPATAFLFNGGYTDLSGSHLGYFTPLPDEAALVGLTFFSQWAVVTAPAACGALGVDLSNALEVTIQ